MESFPEKLWRAAAVILLFILWFFAASWLASCTMTRGPITKQAPKPPYAGELHDGMDGAVYLRVTGHEGEWK